MLQQASLQDCEALPYYIELSNSFYQELLGMSELSYLIFLSLRISDRL